MVCDVISLPWMPLHVACRPDPNLYVQDAKFYQTGQILAKRFLAIS